MIRLTKNQILRRVDTGVFNKQLVEKYKKFIINIPDGVITYPYSESITGPFIKCHDFKMNILETKLKLIFLYQNKGKRYSINLLFDGNDGIMWWDAFSYENGVRAIEFHKDDYIKIEELTLDKLDSIFDIIVERIEFDML